MEHADENMVTETPGMSGEIIWQFSTAGKVNFARLQPSQYDAGMKRGRSMWSKAAPPPPSIKATTITNTGFQAAFRWVPPGTIG